MDDERIRQIAYNATYGFMPPNGVDDVIYMLRKMGVRITPLSEYRRCPTCEGTGAHLGCRAGSLGVVPVVSPCPTCQGKGSLAREKV